MFTRKQQILKRPELSLELSSARLDDSMDIINDFKKVEEKKKSGRGRKPGWRKSGNLKADSKHAHPLAEPKKSMLL